MLDAEDIKLLIKKHQHGNIVNVAGIARAMGIDVMLSDKLTCMARVFLAPDEIYPTIHLNRRNCEKANLSLVAIALAEVILNPEKLARRPIEYDDFYLYEMREFRMTFRNSPTMLLASRLAIPSHVLESHDQDVLNVDENCEQQGRLLREFLACCVSNRSARFAMSKTLYKSVYEQVFNTE